MGDLGLTYAVLALAALGAGALNAVAGGGTFLTFPALVWAGVPPIAANATSAFAVMPGYAGSALGFRAELAALPRALLAREMLICAVGGVAGALLLLITPARLFAGIVPWLLLFATALFALGPQLARWAGSQAQQASGGAARWLGLLAVAVYGGYFNGGLGILLMALYLLVGEARLNTVNALKNLNSLVLSVVSVAAFAVGGAIVWPQGLWMALFATLGGFAGARLARRLPVRVVRAIVIATGLVMAGLFFARGQGGL
ncbi:MAG: sulfite exporter TauE/SafE family protein [Pseudomonadota bacterium]|nr:sulfite exporter TauE/SafE family protein [Pseudomonadota bacterium]